MAAVAMPFRFFAGVVDGPGPYQSQQPGEPVGPGSRCNTPSACGYNCSSVMFLGTEPLSGIVPPYLSSMSPRRSRKSLCLHLRSRQDNRGRAWRPGSSNRLLRGGRCARERFASREEYVFDTTLLHHPVGEAQFLCGGGIVQIPLIYRIAALRRFRVVIVFGIQAKMALAGHPSLYLYLIEFI